jgi:hypothetical protein
MRWEMTAKRDTHMQSFQREDWTTTLDRFVYLFVECLPIIERFYTKELDKGVEFFDVILPDMRVNIAIVEKRVDSQRRSCQAPPIFAVQSAACLGGFRAPVLDVVRLV